MEKKDINWGELGFSYQQTEKRFVANFKDGAWDEGIYDRERRYRLFSS